MSEPFLDEVTAFFEPRFRALLPPQTPGSNLADALAYVVENPGKRLRPALVFATGRSFGMNFEQMFPAAAAVEFIHTYSLVHDDLPSMDNDDLRRGRPTCHKAFDEATAILVGDALQAMAFEQLSHPSIDSKLSQSSIYCLSRAAGPLGLVGGQAQDMQNTLLTPEALELLHLSKTGALFSASIELGALFSNQSEETIDRLRTFSALLGLAFQIKDDILDVTADTQTLGKPHGSDIKNHKTTYLSLYGLESSQDYLISTYECALDQLEALDIRSEALRELSDFVINRVY